MAIVCVYPQDLFDYIADLFDVDDSGSDSDESNANITGKRLRYDRSNKNGVQ